MIDYTSRLAGPSPALDPQLRELQLVELSILREFVRLCERHGLRYYLAYGTLLGAVRQRGFIPWDDDIDVTMLRQDYERFARVCALQAPAGFSWQSHDTHEEYPHIFGKFVKDGTVLRQAFAEHLQYEQPIYIDVFPLDGRANGRWAILLQRFIVRCCRLRLGVKIKRSRIKTAIVQLARLVPRRLAIALFKFATRAWPAERSQVLICAGGHYGYGRQSFPRQWIGEGEPQVFEGLTLIGPSQWHEYLTHLYGDYLTPPPTADRASHHQVTALRLDVTDTVDE